MSFQDLVIKPEYRSLNDNVVKEFYIPLLEKASLYKRAVGFFSSTSLIEISKGIIGLVKNGGKMLLVASPKLSDKDIEAINKGFKLKNKIIEKAIKDSITPPKDFYEEKRLNLLVNLIANGQLDIKIAFTENNDKIGIFHEKMGLLYDDKSNIVAFTGSMNETSTAFSYNYESIDVFCSWTSERTRVIAKEDAFESIWNNYESGINVIDFPQVAKEELEKYKVSDSIDLENEFEIFEKNKYVYGFDFNRRNNNIPSIPKDVNLYDYQIEAIDNWEQAKYSGIFDMATGTGKTYTALGAIVRLSDYLKGKLAVIIVCPYQHLVEQWVEDVKKFSMKPIVAYSTSKQTDWKKRLKNVVIDFNIDVIENFCLVTTNATFCSNYVQNEVSRIKGNILLVVDEAHNFGANRLSKCLNTNIPYRLALSATLERHNDQEGTRRLFEYFGEKNIQYSLERAIKENKLVRYYYYPEIIYFTDRELEKYREITKKIFKTCKFKKNGKMEITKATEILLIQRSRIIAGAAEKISKLKELMIDFKNKNHILIYCGATTINDITYNENYVDEFEIRQIDAVTKMLGFDLNMNISRFTSQESRAEREELIKEFSQGDAMQALVAIRCLDEGVNIPSIETAFILASSTNPKEYIQRRGRVLRKFKGKSKAIIYDFITLPRSINEAYLLSNEELKMEVSLVKREIARMKDFASIAENSSIADSIIDELEEAYKINFIGGEEYGI